MQFPELEQDDSGSYLQQSSPTNNFGAGFSGMNTPTHPVRYTALQSIGKEEKITCLFSHNNCLQEQFHWGKLHLLVWIMELSWVYTLQK